MTPTKMAAMRDGFASGLSARAVAKQIGVGAATVAEWRKRDTAGSAEPKAAKVPRVAAADVEAAASALAAPLPSPNDPEALVKVRERASLVQGLLERLTDAVEADEYPATSFVTLARYGDDLARFIAELSPPAPRDPNEDPDVLESERILIGRLSKLVTEAEKRA